MWYGAQAFVFAALGLLAGVSVSAKKYNMTVGYLPSIRCEHRDRQGHAISGAISMALEEVNNSTDILPDVQLLLKWNDTRCDTVTATKLLTDMSCSGVVAFFGPEGRCHTEAIIAQARNLPMISYKCSDYQTSTLSNFVSLRPSDTQAVKAVISLLRYYRWNKFSILYEESWVTMALTLTNHAKKMNMTVNHQRPVIDSFKCCEEKMTCCAPGFWYQYIQDTKTSTRIYVFLGTTSGLIEMMSAMEYSQLFAKGEYMVIFVDMLTYSSKDSLKYLIQTEDRGQKLVCRTTPEFKKRAQSLLVVVSSEPTGNYEVFSKKVRQYNNMKPFEFPLPPIFKNNSKKFVSIYAAYLYDSVKLYAIALDKIIKEETEKEALTYSKLMSIATNGSRIVAEMIKSSPYKSVSGVSIRLDERADSEGNFSVLAFKPTNFSDEINCSYSMIPVGLFQYSSREYPFVSIYAAYLYDSVRLYAIALDKIIKEETEKEALTYSKLMSIATNGSRIVAEMIKSSPYKSVAGLSIRLDERGDSEGHFSVLAFKPTNFSDEINCSYSMIPVGLFQYSSREYPEYKLNPRLPIDWPDSVKPKDEPSSGFLNEKCIP